MDRQGVETSVLSLLGTFCWIESQPVEVSLPLCRRVNDGFSAICQEHPGRFAAFAALPEHAQNQQLGIGRLGQSRLFRPILQLWAHIS
jgi:predicted TIM-barrel fold metal-dependent hydrolase